MAEKTIDGALLELQQARAELDTAKAELQKAEENKADKVEQIKTLMDELKEKAKELGIEIVSNVNEAKDAVQEKLDEAKEDFAEEAATDPDGARRKLRLIWGCIGLIVGAVIGFGGGYLYCYLS